MEKTGSKRLFTPLDELRYAQVDAARLSPDGKNIVYSLRQVNSDTEKETCHLWLRDLERGRTIQLTRGEHSNSAPCWSPDGRWVAFLSSRAGKGQIFVIAPRGGEALQLTHLSQGVGGGPLWSPDGKHIAFTASPQPEPRDMSKPYRLTRSVYRMDGVGYIDDVVQNIFVLPISSPGGVLKAGDPRQLTDDAFLPELLDWSPSGAEILYDAYYKPDSLALFSPRLRVVNLDGIVDEILSEEWGDVGQAAWLPDGEHIALYAGVAGAPGGSKDDLWVVNRRAKQPACRTQGFEFGFEGRTGRLMVLDAERALCSVMRAGMEEIYEFRLSGEPGWKPVITGQRWCAGLDVQANRLLFLVNRLHNPAELYVANLDGSGEEQVTHHNDAWLAEIDLPQLEHFEFTNQSGVPVEGWFLRPAVGQAPFPAVLCIHGGPYGMYGYAFRSDFQMLAGAGFGIVFINPTGSNGYGDAFSHPLNARWGIVDGPEQMQALDLAVEKGWIDPNRLGVNGLSYGGYMTCWLVGQTDRFKGAVAENPVTDLISQYGTSDMDAWDAPHSLGGHPHENYEGYRAISPITYAHRCTTPTLLIQCEQDYRCPAGQSEQFYSHLKAAGCVVEMLRLPGGSHIGSIAGAIPLRKAQNEALLAWMEKYVKNEKGK